MLKSSCAAMNPFVTKPWEIHWFSRWFICGNPSRFRSWSMFLFIQTISWLPNCWSNTPCQHEIQLHQNYLSTSYNFLPRSATSRRHRNDANPLSLIRLPGSGDLMASTAPTSSSVAATKTIMPVPKSDKNKKQWYTIVRNNSIEQHNVQNIRTATRTINWE